MLRQRQLVAPEISLPEVQQMHAKGKALNSELKALTLGSMEFGESYSAVGGNKAFLDLQGDEPIPSGNRKNQFDYCAKSFLPAGLVQSVDNRGHLEYELTEEGEQRGKSMAGVILKFSMTHPKPAQVHMIGNLASKRADSRPFYQFELLNLLSAQPDETPLSRREILSAVPMPRSTLSFIANNLSDIGLAEKVGNSHLLMPQDWHEPVNEFCTSIQRILDGDMRAIKAGKAMLNKIISVPDDVKDLVEKGLAASSDANKIAPELMRELVIKSVRQGNHSSIEIAGNIAQLRQRSVDPTVVRRALNSLIEQGTVTSKRSTRSRALLYSLVETGKRSSKTPLKLVA